MKIMVTLPGRPGNNISAGLLQATHDTGCSELVHCFKTSHLSLLTTNFNTLWCEALNARAQGVTHFCMMHDDVAPEPGWLKKLVDELGRTKADVLSTVIPLKDERGLTSTGIMDENRRMKKLSLREALSLPNSFNAKALCRGLELKIKDPCLLMNTGLWICPITDPWAEMICFRQKDTIVKMLDGKFQPSAVSEDWLFSVDCWRLGLKTMATTAIKVKHQGTFEYPNFAPWGSNEDEGRWASAWNTDPPDSWKALKDDPIRGGKLMTGVINEQVDPRGTPRAVEGTFQPGAAGCAMP